MSMYLRIGYFSQFSFDLKRVRTSIGSLTTLISSIKSLSVDSFKGAMASMLSDLSPKSVLYNIMLSNPEVNTALDALGKTKFKSSDSFWTSSQVSQDDSISKAYVTLFSGGAFEGLGVPGTGLKTNTGSVCVIHEF